MSAVGSGMSWPAVSMRSIVISDHFRRCSIEGFVPESWMDCSVCIWGLSS